jgi:hypothetical protein
MDTVKHIFWHFAEKIKEKWMYNCKKIRPGDLVLSINGSWLSSFPVFDISQGTTSSEDKSITTLSFLFLLSRVLGPIVPPLTRIASALHALISNIK